MVTEIRRTLPGVAYHSDETYAVDTERVFYRNWVYVGRAERVAKAGAWVRVEIAGESILIVGGKDEQLRAGEPRPRPLAGRGVQRTSEPAGRRRLRARPAG